jgi:hypothetical protein
LVTIDVDFDGNALGGWPLPALADGCALHATRTKVSSAVETEDTQKQMMIGF